MAFTDIYRRQVELLVRTIPHVAEEECFALKGGTAINLFYRDLPRLSVDIDLTYLPIADREKSLRDIDVALKRIGSRIKKSDTRITITESAPGTQDAINKLVVRTPNRVHGMPHVFARPTAPGHQNTNLQRPTRLIRAHESSSRRQISRSRVRLSMLPIP